MTRIRILSYNIHKGFHTVKQSLVLDRIRESLRKSGADILFLQEVVGENADHAENLEDWPLVPQFEYLADKAWDHFAYGKNAVTSMSNHGNAILSKFPIESFDNINISTNSREQRGLLHAQIRIPGTNQKIELMNVHLNLFHVGRALQIQQISERIDKMISKDSPLILGGDFNDWRNRLSRPIKEGLHMREAFQEYEGNLARTFPSFFPLLSLDRLYFRNIHLKEARRHSGKPWSELSDHLAIAADFEI